VASGTEEVEVFPVWEGEPAGALKKAVSIANQMVTKRGCSHSLLCLVKRKAFQGGDETANTTTTPTLYRKSGAHGRVVVSPSQFLHWKKKETDKIEKKHD